MNKFKKFINNTTNDIPLNKKVFVNSSKVNKIYQSNHLIQSNQSNKTSQGQSNKMNVVNVNRMNRSFELSDTMREIHELRLKSESDNYEKLEKKNLMKKIEEDKSYSKEVFLNSIFEKNFDKNIK